MNQLLSASHSLDIVSILYDLHTVRLFCTRFQMKICLILMYVHAFTLNRLTVKRMPNLIMLDISDLSISNTGINTIL